MKSILALVLAMVLISPAFAEKSAIVRGVGTQSCETLVASDQVDKQFAQQAAQWILGNLTGYFHNTGDVPSRTIADAILLQTVLDVCKKNAEKTIDEAVTIAIESLPATEIQKPAK